MQMLQTLKGFRDFLPSDKRKRDFVAGKIKETFELFGFEPLETPTLEYAELLLGKYGNEADKLVYSFKDRGERNVALRYDQTVPTARVLAQYRAQLPAQFRRYQMQNVFRADKPQKGRYREFAQCDIDIFGSVSPMADAEILACTYASYTNIGFKNIELKINDRQVLMSSLGAFANDTISIFSLIQTLDKLEKIGRDGVQAELVEKGLIESASTEALGSLEGAQLSENLRAIIDEAIALGVPQTALVFTPSLARGLDYYTGMIFEANIVGQVGGSLGGGGRYDRLIEQLSGESISAVGMAFGFDRTVEAAEELGLLPSIKSTARVLVTVFNKETEKESLEVAHLLRTGGVNTQLYCGEDKLGKQLKLADQQQIPFAVIVGDDEIDRGVVTVKDLVKEEQHTVRRDQLVSFFAQT